MYALAFMAASSLLSSAGQAYGASQAIKQGKYQKDILGYAADYQAALVNIDQAKLDRVRDQTIASQTAQTAASGIRTDVGAPLELRAETEILSDIDKHILRTSGGIENLRYGIAGHASLAQGYGTGSALYARGLSYLVNAGGYMASRQLAPTKSTTDSLLTNGATP